MRAVKGMFSGGQRAPETGQMQAQQEQQMQQLQKQNDDMEAVERGRRKLARGGVSLMSFLDEKLSTKLGG